jgi:hypothetical protein
LGQGSIRSMTYIPSLVKTSVGVQEILRFCLKYLCNVGITDERDFFKYAVEMGPRIMIYLPSFT